MNAEVQMYDTVALLEDVPAKHFLTGQDIVLRRGQVGAVVMTYDGSAFEVEFSGRDGRAYAILPIKAEKLIVLREALETAAA
jgi:hypothetical protein